MESPTTIYPPGPTGIPEDLASPPRGYHVRVVVMLVSLVLFMLVYLGLMAGAVFLVYRAVFSSFDDTGPVFLLLRGAAAVVGVLLFFFLLRGLLRRSRPVETAQVEITEAEQPELFAFVRRLCAETKAPLPRKVFLTAEVNAAVTYELSALGLVWPLRKDLILGLGLVNTLNLTEFKAVLAHELGHFSQRSMKLGTYVYVANQILANVVYGRDWFDEMLTHAEHPVFRITPVVLLFRGVLWCVRTSLTGLYRILNFWHAELSRAMEFNADLLAVSVSGSDAMVHALARLDSAEESLDQALYDLRAAAAQRLFSRDLFHHQTRAVAYLRELFPELHRETLPASPEATVFDPNDNYVPAMWASHPTNPERERNAKRRYCPGPLDARSAWALFREPQRVREQVSRSFLRAGHLLPRDAELAEPEIVQRFIDEEHAGTTFDQRYHGLYDERRLEPGSVTELCVLLTTLEPWPDERIHEGLARLDGEGTRRLAEHYHERTRERESLTEIQNGARTPPRGLVEFRGNEYPLEAIPGLLAKVEAELTAERRKLAALDREVFILHAQMSSRLGPEAGQELLGAYEFHLRLQELLQSATAEQARLEEVCRLLAENSNLTEPEYEHILTQFQESHEALRMLLFASETLFVPPLANIRPDEALRGLLLRAPLVTEPGSELSWDWLESFRIQVDEVHEHLARIHRKSTGAILKLQERVAREWREGHHY